MKKISIIILASVVSILLTGCISTKSYVDPQYRKASFADIKSVETRYEVNLVAEFERDGVHQPKMDVLLKERFQNSLRASGIIIPIDNPAQFTIHITVNNITDLGSAVAKGFGTGLTFGLVGSEVADYYNIRITMTGKNGESLTGEYKHALLTTIGNHKAPIENVAPTTPDAGFTKVIEDATLNFIHDMQTKGHLTLIPFTAIKTVRLGSGLSSHINRF